VNCMTSLEPSAPYGAPPAGLPAVPAPRMWNRQAAASCLQAAATTEDAVERSFLRRLAAELILPRPAGIAVRRSERGA
jgi:hypothetical protein